MHGHQQHLSAARVAQGRPPSSCASADNGVEAVREQQTQRVYVPAFHNKIEGPQLTIVGVA